MRHVRYEQEPRASRRIEGRAVLDHSIGGIAGFTDQITEQRQAIRLIDGSLLAREVVESCLQL
jgi:hypothetical protein